MVAFAAGLWRTLPARRSARIGATLVGLFGLGLLVAGVFVTDPALDYPSPTTGAAAHTLHGIVHGLAGLACFTLLPAALFAPAWCLRHADDWRGWPATLALCGMVVIVCFIASTAASTLDATGRLPNAPTGLLQRVAIVSGWGALAGLSWRLRRQLLTRRGPRPAGTRQLAG